MKPPKAPDPYATAAAQGATNRETAITQQLLNMTNQITPYGSLRYDQSGMATLRDPKTGNIDFTVPTFTATTKLSPEQQRLFQQEQQFDQQSNALGLRQLGAVSEHLAKPFNYSPGGHETWAGGLYDTINSDRISRDRQALDSALANKGLKAGSEGYGNTMGDFMDAERRARNDFMLDSYNTGLNTALTMRNQPLNETAALVSGQQVTQPTFTATPHVGVNGVDIAGLVAQNYQTRANQYNNKLGGLFGLGGAAAGWALGG